MAYYQVRIMEIKELIRRLQDGQSINKVSKATGRDRKTIRKYISGLQEKDIEINQVDLNDEKHLEILCQLHRQNKRKTQSQDLFSPYKEEIRKLVEDPKKSFKLKSVYEIITKRHSLEAKTSYSSFKRFVSNEGISRRRKEITCRIETPPAGEIQVDYCKVGMKYDPRLKRKRVLYAFIGTLSYSRHKYVEYVYKQDQRSFVDSHIKMFNFFGGITRTIVIDNLKAGVIKPDLYDPKLNITYQEMAEYYGCFIDTSRVASPKDKAKVERDVQTIREEYKKLIELYGDLPLCELNQKIKEYLIHQYGKRKHGTTNQAPYTLFTEVERPLLRELPREEFEVCQWKQAKVHPDCYIQVNKKSYSIPYQYMGKSLWVKQKSRTIEAYYNEKLIKTHPIPVYNRQTDFNDFPEKIKSYVDDGLPVKLQIKAKKISGSNLSGLINKILTPHAYINLRKAQALVSLAEKYPSALVEKAAAKALLNKENPSYKKFKRLLNELYTLENQEDDQQQSLPISEQTEDFIRDSDYFIKP